MIDQINQWALVNPYIPTIKNVKNSDEMSAARSLYKKLSRNFNNDIPEFWITIQKLRRDSHTHTPLVGGGSSGDYHSFRISEIRDETNDKKVNFTIEKVETTEKNMNRFISELNTTIKENKKMSGGAKKKQSKKNSKKKRSKKTKVDDSSESSDSDSSTYLHKRSRRRQLYVNEFSPTRVWVYHPYLYAVKKVIIPTLVQKTRPYFFVSLP